MSRYRQTMSELLEQVRAPKESADYLMPKLNPSQINNIKKTWSMKTAKDITPAIRDMIKKMDIPTQMAIKQAKINQLSKLVEEEYLPEFNDSMIQTLKKEYEPMRNKTISVTNANKLGALFTRFDSNKNALEKLYGADIPFISTMAMTRLMTKHGYKADKLNKIRKEELDLLEEAELLGEGTGKITGFRDNKEKSNMVSLAKQHSLKVKDIPGGIELSGNMRKILDMQLAVRSHLKTEEIDEGRMSDIDAMRKRGASAAEIAKELKIDVKAVKAILGEELIEEEDAEKLKAELEDKEKEIAMLKQKAETDKAKATKKATEKLVNPETGEPLLQVGIAYKHMKDKMAKEKAAEVRMKRKDEEEKKKAVQKFKDRIKESLNLDESDASDQAKNMGLDYMKFGRYGKDGKVTHISKGGQLVKTTGDKDVDDVNKSLAKARGDKKKDEPKQEPAPKPKIDKFDAQKDLEKEVTDGMIDVEDDGEGGLSMNKEYEPSQDYEAERDTIAIKDYLMDKGVDEDDIYIDVDTEDDYISVSVQVRGKKVEEMKKDDAYAIGMAQAKKVMNDEPPLQKKTIKKGHEIADKILKKEETITEFKRMTVRIRDKNKMKKAIADLEKQNLGLSVLDKGMYQVIQVVGNNRDLNNIAKDLKNFYGAEIKAEETIVEFTSQQIKMAYGVANDKRYKGGNYSGAVKAIEKIARGLSQHPDVQKVLKRTNENLDEGKYTRYSDLLIQLGRMKQAKDKQGEMNTQKEIDKEKKKLGINESAAAAEIQKNNTRRDSMDYNMYKKSVELLRKKDYKALGKHIYDAETAPREYVMGVIDKKEPQAFKKMFGNQSGYYSLMKPLKMSKEEVNMKEHPAKAVYEQIKGLKNKAEKSGMPYSILKKVYDRGMAAWRGGHRPGTSQQQWAFARVNSFVTKSSGTWGGADKDLAKQVRGSK